MNYKYWIQEWAKVRKDEIIRLPEEYIVNDYFLSYMSKSDIIDAFAQIWQTYIKVYGDIESDPQSFGLPLY